MLAIFVEKFNDFYFKSSRLILIQRDLFKKLSGFFFPLEVSKHCFVVIMLHTIKIFHGMTASKMRRGVLIEAELFEAGFHLILKFLGPKVAQFYLLTNKMIKTTNLHRYFGKIPKYL